MTKDILWKTKELQLVQWIAGDLPNEAWTRISEIKNPENPLLQSIVHLLRECQDFLETLRRDLRSLDDKDGISEFCLHEFTAGKLERLSLETLLTSSPLKVLCSYPRILTKKDLTTLLLDKFSGAALDCQRNEYFAFMALYTVVIYVLESFVYPERAKSESKLAHASRFLEAISDEDKRLALLEDIFSICFLTGNQIESISKLGNKTSTWTKVREQCPGFLCQSSELVRSILNLVEDCLHKFEVVNEHRKTDVKRLSQHTSELKWKLDTLESLPKAPEYPKKELCLCLLYTVASSDSEDGSNASATGTKLLESTESSDTSRSCTSPESIQKQTRRPRQRSHVKQEPKRRDARCGIVNKLLCSPTELTILCMAAGQQSLALDIVKMWNLWDTSEGHEVLFSKAFDDLRHKLVSFDKSAVLRAASSPVKFSPKGSSPGLLKGLRRATSSSIGSSAIPNLIEDLVSNNAPGQIMRSVDMEEFVRQFVAVDLAISGSLQYPSTHTLLSMVDADLGDIKVYPVSLREWYGYVQDLKQLITKLYETRESFDQQNLFSLPSSSALLTRTQVKDPKVTITDFQQRLKLSTLLDELSAEAGIKDHLELLDNLAKVFPDSNSFVKGIAVFTRSLFEGISPYCSDLKSLSDLLGKSPQELVTSVFLNLPNEKVRKFQADLSAISVSLPHFLANSSCPNLKVRECDGQCFCTEASGQIDPKILEYLSAEEPVCAYFANLSNGNTQDVPDYLVSYARSKRRQSLAQNQTGGLQICLKKVLEHFQWLAEKGEDDLALSVAVSSHPPFLDLKEVKNFLEAKVKKETATKIENSVAANDRPKENDCTSLLLSNLSPEYQAQLQHCHDPIILYEVFLMNGLFQQISDTAETAKRKIGQPFFKEKLDDLFLRYAEKAILLEEDSMSGKSFAGTSRASSESYLVLGSSGSYQSPQKQDQGIFQMPPSTPTKEDWIPDSQVSDCMCCKQVSFSTFNRRHHCRRCGRVVCSSCSRQRMEVAGYNDVQVKVCNDCYQQTEEIRASQQNNSVSGSLDHRSEPPQGGNYLIWTLTGDRQHDDIVRAEFAYESAPDAQLCLRILEFVSSFLTTSEFLLSMGDKLLDSLNSRSVSDRNFLLQITKSLVLAAKVQISAENTRIYSLEEQAPDNVLKQLQQVMKKCDSVSSRLDVLVLLEAANCGHLLQKKQPNFRQLRQKLIDEERWQLALEVSTKCGLDANTVWASWGLVCLKAGNLNGARSRLSKCLEPRRVSPVLDEVVNILESLAKVPNALVTRRPTDLGENTPQYLQSRLDQLLSICEGPTQPPRKDIKRTSSERCINEAEFYLKTYGSPQALLAFYVRLGMIAAGLQFVKKNKTPVDVFVSGFLLPACELGIMEEVLKVVKQVEPMLEFWKDYISDVCKELRRRSYLHTAKRLYCWVGDSVQAGQTCCAIYSSQSISFSKMTNAKYLLLEAELHLNQYLESRIALGFTLIDEEVQSVERMVRIIKLQLGAHDYLLECQERLSRESEPESPTILSYIGTEKKKQVATLVRRESTAKFQEMKQKIPTLFDDENSIKNVVHLLIVIPTVDPTRLQLAFRICIDLDLPWNPAVERAICQLTIERRCSELSVLVNFARYQQRVAGLSSSKLDDILSRAVQLLNMEERMVKDSEFVIGLIENLSAKISAYLSLGWLQSAYALAVRSQSVDDVRRIQQESEIRNETGVQRLCSNWLALYGNR